MNLIRKFIFLLLLAVFIVNLAAAQTIVEAAGRGDSNKISDTQLKKGEAAVWYLYHCGWAVKTASAALVHYSSL